MQADDDDMHALPIIFFFSKQNNNISGRSVGGRQHFTSPHSSVRTQQIQYGDHKLTQNMHANLQLNSIAGAGDGVGGEASCIFNRISRTSYEYTVQDICI